MISILQSNAASAPLINAANCRCPAVLCMCMYVYIWFVPTNLPISPQQLTSSSHLHSPRRFCLCSIVVESVSVVMLHCCAVVPRPLLRKPRRRSWFTHYCPLSECSGAIIRARAAGVKQRGNPRCIHPLRVCKTCLDTRDLPSHPRWYERVRLCSSVPPPPGQCRDLGTIWASDHLCLCHPVPRKWDIFPSACLCSDHWSTFGDCNLQSPWQDDTTLAVQSSAGVWRTGNILSSSVNRLYGDKCLLFVVNPQLISFLHTKSQ